MAWLLLLLVVLVGCPTPSHYKEIRPGLACDRATRVAYRTLVELGYTVTELQPAAIGQEGLLAGTKTQRDGTTKVGRVRITCDENGSEIVPVEDAVMPDWEFSRAFGFGFENLEKRPDVEVPTAGVGLEVLVRALTPQQATLDLGGPATRSTAVPVRVTVRNHTPRTVAIDPRRIDLMTADGDPVAPLTGAALESALDPGPGGARVRKDILGARRIAPKTTVEGFLVYPAGAYREAHVAIEDVETGETEGFVAAVQ